MAVTDRGAEPWVRGALVRHPLDATSWVDVGRGWLRDPGEVYAALAERLDWRQAGVYRYDHLRPEPRLSASCRPTVAGPHPAVLEVHRALRRHYRVGFLPVVGLSWYRDGRDALGAHREHDPAPSRTDHRPGRGPPNDAPDRRSTRPCPTPPRPQPTATP